MQVVWQNFVSTRKHVDLLQVDQLTKKWQKTRRPTAGRPADKEMAEAFEKFYDHFENSMDCEIYSVKELPEKMLRFNKNGYSLKSFREKLKSRFKEHVYYVKVNNSELVCFDNMTDYILREMKEKFSTKESVLTAAAKIIKVDIFSHIQLSYVRELNVEKSKYPNEQEIADIDKGRREWVPESLDRFMRQLVNSTLY